MNVDLTGLKPGQWRDLTEQELNNINVAVASSRKTSEKAEKHANEKQVHTENKIATPSQEKPKKPVRYVPNGATPNQLATPKSSSKAGKKTLSLSKTKK